MSKSAKIICTILSTVLAILVILGVTHIASKKTAENIVVTDETIAETAEESETEAAKEEQTEVVEPVETEGTEETEESKADADAVEETGATAETDTADVKANEKSPAAELSYEDLVGCEFYFSSGMGGWRTLLYIDSDGSFSGCYSDADMGVTGPGYQYGTYYICEFSGAFEKLEKVNDYTYKTHIAHLDYDRDKEDTEEIIDEMRYIYSYPYGLDSAEDIYFYTEQTPAKELNSNILTWIGYWYSEIEELTDEDTVGCIVLYNETPQYAFSGTRYSESI